MTPTKSFPTTREGLQMLVVTSNLLFPNHDGGSRHLIGLLRGFIRQHCHVEFLPLTPVELDSYSGSLVDAAHEMRQAGITVHYTQGGPISLPDFLHQYGQHFDVILLFPEYIAMRAYPLVKQFAPDALTVFNTIDLIHIRLFRTAKHVNSLNAIQGAIRGKRQEVWLTNHCDYTLVVSAEEQSILRGLCPQADIRVVPSVWHQTYSDRPFSERLGLLMIGSFPYSANVDAVKYFFDEIYPIILQRIPDLPCTIVGVAPPSEIQALSQRYKQVTVTGEVPALEPYCAQVRLTASPLRYGAGIKTKNLFSMSCGVPVVTTTIGAEGLHLTDGVNALVADDAANFAESVVSLYQDEALWQRLTQGARSILTEHFSEHALDLVITQLIEQVREARLTNRDGATL
jgi:glycosyltransferase involved in cell wall biosynthesis